MRKNIKRILSCISCCSMLPTTILPFTTSCFNSQQDKITAIHLYPESNTLRPNESINIRAVVEPSLKRTNDLTWELINCPYPEITINNSGVLTASAFLSVDDLSSITVKASAGPDVFDTCDITILPLPSYDFQGFVNNEIQYVDRGGNICTQQIQKTGEFTYCSSQNIDVFEMEQEIPPTFTSFIDFKPIISGTSLPYMKFELLGGEYAPHALAWDTYDDGDWTETIPKFTVIDSSVLFDTINVYFACDPNVCLTINFNAWQNPGQQSSEVKVSYIPIEEDDPHSIEQLSENIYKCFIYCPALSKIGTFTQSLSSIYVYRPKYEFLDLTFNVEPADGVDPSIKKMLQTNPSIGSTFKPKMYERYFDHFRYYKFDLSYNFDLENREHTADYWKYDNLPLFNLAIYDDDGQTSFLACRIEFFIAWV